MSISALSAIPRFQNISDETTAQETAPISDIVEGFDPTDQRVQFCYLVAQKTLNSLLSYQYTDFDAQTTANCCHGISLLARELINKVKSEDLEALHTEITKKLLSAALLDSDYQIPKALQQLSQMYILNYIREIDPVKGVRSSYKKLNQLGKLGSLFYDNLVKQLQKKYANLVANRYREYSDPLPGTTEISDAPVALWAKYVSPPYLRTDSKGVNYAPCMFSMQVSLAHLIRSEAKIALVNDISVSIGEHQQYIRILQGDGRSNFRSIDATEEVQPGEPVTVFGGCSTNSNPSEVIEHMEESLEDFPKLVLACDAHYPQFPKVQNDPKFNCTPIMPEEQALVEVIERQKTVKGVSAKDPSLFCLNHIYSSSLKQISETIGGNGNLPFYKIPTTLQNS